MAAASLPAAEGRRSARRSRRARRGATASPAVPLPGRQAGACRVSDGQPHDIDAERVVLGALMSGASLADVRPLGPADFYGPAHQILFEVVSSLAAAGRPAEPVAVHDELRHRRQVRSGQRRLPAHPDRLCAHRGQRRALRRMVRGCWSAPDHRAASRVIQAATDPAATWRRPLLAAASPAATGYRPAPATACGSSAWPTSAPSGSMALDGPPAARQASSSSTAILASGKSMLTVDFAARVSTGSPWPDGQPCEPSRRRAHVR